MTIEDALHIPPAVRARMVAGYPAYERGPAPGRPDAGSGRIFHLTGGDDFRGDDRASQPSGQNSGAWTSASTTPSARCWCCGTETTT